jgi:hypothetical protein
MRDQSRHRSVETLRGYVRDAEIFTEHARRWGYCKPAINSVPTANSKSAVEDRCEPGRPRIYFVTIRRAGVVGLGVGGEVVSMTHVFQPCLLRHQAGDYAGNYPTRSRWRIRSIAAAP